MELGASIKAIRKEKGLSQKALAEAVKISQNALVQIENDLSFPKQSTLNRIAQVLDVSPYYILFVGLSEEDVSPEKRAVFRELAPVLMNLFK